jgi:hypothetical protein
MSKKYKLNLIKTRESYNTKTITKLLGVHARTIHDWCQEGLKVLNRKPLLIMGFDLKEFLNNKAADRKHKLLPNEFYCIKCRKAVKGISNKAYIQFTGKTLGRQGLRELIVKGFCEICGTKQNKFSHEGCLQEHEAAFNLVEKGDLSNG